MGIITDYIASTESVDTTYPSHGIDRAVLQELKGYAAKNDPEFDDTNYGSEDAVHRVLELAIDPTSATYKLRFHLNGLPAVTTGDIAIADDEADVQGIINTAMADVPGWEDDDIVVTNETSSGDDITDGYFEITFSGDSVADKGHGLTEIILTAPALASPAESTETPGDDDTMTPVDEVQRIAQFANAVTGGTYTLTLNLAGADPITTEPLAFDADETDIEAAIDTAVAAAEYPSFSAEDISVAPEGSAGDTLEDGYMEITFDGTSVAGTDHGQTTIDGSNLVTADFLADPAVTSEANGAANREALQILQELNVVTFTPGDPGDVPTDLAAGPKKYTHYPSLSLIRALARDAGRVEASDELQAAILDVLGVSA